MSIVNSPTVPLPVSFQPWEWADQLALVLPELNWTRLDPGEPWQPWAASWGLMPSLQGLPLPDPAQYGDDFQSWAMEAYYQLTQGS